MQSTEDDWTEHAYDVFTYVLLWELVDFCPHVFFVFILASSLFSLLADESPNVHAAGLGELKIVVASLQPEQLADLTPDVRQVSSFFCLLTSVSYPPYIHTPYIHTAHLLYQPTTD